MEFEAEPRLNPAPLVEKTVFPTRTIMALSQKSVDLISGRVYLCNLKYFPIVYMKTLYHNTLSVLLNYQHCIIVSFEIEKCESSKFVVNFKEYFGYSQCPEFSYYLQDKLINFCQEGSNDFGRDCREICRSVCGVMSLKKLDVIHIAYNYPFKVYKFLWYLLHSQYCVITCL